MDCCERVMKYFLFTVNLIILIVGTIVTVTSVLSLVSKPSYTGTKGSLDILFIILLIVGIIWMSIAIFGIIAALREVKCMLLTYAIIVFILFVITIISQVHQYNSHKEMMKLLEKRLKSSMQLYNDNKFVRNYWDITQSMHKCCGLNSWKDWKTYGQVPRSCCKSDQQLHCIDDWHIYKEGCINELRGQLQNFITIINGVNVAFICLLLCGVIFSFALYKKIKHQQNILYEAGNNKDKDPEK